MFSGSIFGNNICEIILLKLDRFKIRFVIYFGCGVKRLTTRKIERNVQMYRKMLLFIDIIGLGCKLAVNKYIYIYIYDCIWLVNRTVYFMCYIFALNLRRVCVSEAFVMFNVSLR